MVENWDVQRIPLDDLHLDLSNPRLADFPKEQSESNLLRLLWHEMAVDELALSIAENGFFDHEPLFAAREEKKLVVIEGNRRLAAVKLLRDASLRKKLGATDLPKITAKRRRELETLPVIVSTRGNLWQFIGFKHVNGPQSWDSFAKAKYINWVHNSLKIPLSQIAAQIGDRHDTVLRLNHGYQVLQQAEKIGAFSINDRWKNHFSFSHLYTGLSYPGISSFIGISSKSDKANPVPKTKQKNLRHLFEWLYGSKSKNLQPVVQSQNPDLRVLDEVLQSKEAAAALSSGLPLQTARDIGRGDERVFREALQQAKHALQNARGTLPTGFSGGKSEIETAEDILDLAELVVEEMRAYSRSGAKRRGRRGRTNR